MIGSPPNVAGRRSSFYRDADGRQVIVELPEAGRRLTIGRHERSDIALSWDGEVSRLHAVLELVGVDWVLTDDRMSRNGSYVNGDRVSSRVLRSGDLVAVGETLIAFVAPGRSSGSDDAHRRRLAAGHRRHAGPAPRPGRALPPGARPPAAGVQPRDRRPNSSSPSTRSRAPCHACSSCSRSGPTCPRTRNAHCWLSARCRPAPSATRTWFSSRSG